MVLELLQTADLTSILLVVALIAAFVIAYKIMEMVFDTLLISGISAGFYIGLRTIQGGQITINDLLLFTVLGASLYMAYSFLHSLYKVGATVLPIPYHIVKNLLKPFNYGYRELKEMVENTEDFAPKQTNGSKKKKQEKEEEEDKEDKTTKEVILGSKKDEKDEE